MQEMLDRYIANLEEATRLVKLRVVQDMSDREILTQVQEAAMKLRQICTENNQLLDQLIFSGKPEDFSPEEVRDLTQAADRMFHNAKSIDVGSAFCIHKPDTRRLPLRRKIRIL